MEKRQRKRQEKRNINARMGKRKIEWLNWKPRGKKEMVIEIKKGTEERGG